MSDLTTQDYIKILDFYKKPIPTSRRLIKEHAEKILASKLCRCIKRIDDKYEAKSIGICTKTIINAKGFTRGPFTCKRRQTIHLKKRGLRKTRKSKK